MASAPDPAAFREALASRMQEIEAFAAEEVERLSRLVTSLQADTAFLKGHMVNPGSVDTDVHPPPIPAYPPNHVSPTLFGDMVSPVPIAHGTVKNQEAHNTKKHNMIDVDRMKRWVKDELSGTAPYDVTALYSENGFFQSLAKNRTFENVTLMVIVLNAIWIAIDLDLNDAKDLQDAHPVFQFMENAFCAYFTFEVCVRFMAFANKCKCLTDGWFVFDTILVSMMVIETWVITIVAAIRSMSADGGGSGLGNASVLRMLRLLRLTRMARMARMMRFIPEAMIMIKGMFAGLRSVSITAVLVVVLTYVFAIVFKQLTMEGELGPELFPNVPMAAYNLILQGVFPDNGDMMTQLGEDSAALGFLFFIFLCLVALTFMNMLLGLLCDAIGGVSDEERESNTLAQTREKLEDCLRSIDTNYDGLVSKAEFQGILENIDAIKALQNVDVDVFSLIDDADFIFDGCHKEKLTFDDFMEEVLAFRTNAAATIRCLAGVRKSMRLNFTTIATKLQVIESSMNTPQRTPQVPPVMVLEPM